MKKEIPSNYDLQVDIGRKIFLEYDQERLIRKFSLQADESWIYLTYMNTPCRIHRATGRIDEMAAAQWIECRNFSTVMTIYDLLCHHKGDNAPGLFHQWCTVGTFVVTGVTDTGIFTKKAAALFDGRLEELKAACDKLGGIQEKRMAGADITCRIPVTHFFPVLLQFWEGDDEFPPNAQVLYTDNFEDGFAPEDRVVAGDILITAIKSNM